MNQHILKAAYLEDWIDTIESLPQEIQRNLALIRELDAEYNSIIKDFEKTLPNPKDAENLFEKLLKFSEEKVTLAVQTYDLVDLKIRRLDQDLGKFEEELVMTGPKFQNKRVHKKRKNSVSAFNQPSTIATANAPVITTRRRGTVNSGGVPPGIGRELNKDLSSSLGSIDPNEPTYCICNQVSYGAMIGCDNPDCNIEWFHYECVGLDAPPKGKWYCEDCKARGVGV